MKIVSHKNGTPVPDMQMKYTKNGYVYAIGVDGKTKIGCTKNPEQRMAELKRFVGVFETDHNCLVVQTAEHKRVEKDCHKKLASKRISGEWFNVAFDEAVSVITGLVMEPEQLTDKQIAEFREVDAVRTRNLIQSAHSMRDRNSTQFVSLFNASIGGEARPVIDAIFHRIGETNALNEAIDQTGCPAQLIIFSNDLIVSVWPGGYKQFNSLQDAESDYNTTKQLSVLSGEYPEEAFGAFDDFSIDLRKPELKLIGGAA